MKNLQLNVKCTFEIDREFENVPDDIAEHLLSMKSVRYGTPIYDWLCQNVLQEDEDGISEYDVWNAEEIE